MPFKPSNLPEQLLIKEYLFVFCRMRMTQLGLAGLLGRTAGA